MPVHHTVNYGVEMCRAKRHIHLKGHMFQLLKNKNKLEYPQESVFKLLKRCHHAIELNNSISTKADQSDNQP